MSEAKIQAAIRLALGGRRDCVFWRNNTGIHREGVRVIRYGLANGSSDLIGMVGGRFTALEVKTATGRVSDSQEAFMRLVNKAGGYACVVRSVEEAEAACDAAARGDVCTL
ncbi:MAG: VRR-NUC domain-containing protein [Acidimicrobiales bacterium]